MKDEGDRPVTLPGGVRAHHTRCKNRLAIEQHTACLETACCLHLGPAFPELVVSIERAAPEATIWPVAIGLEDGTDQHRGPVDGGSA